METSGTVKFEANVPLELALKYATGRAVTSTVTNSQQMMYTLADGRRMYLDLHVSARVDELGLKPGEIFTLCKVGKGKDTQWAVRRGPLDETSAYAPKPVAPPEQVLSRQLVAANCSALSAALRAAVSAADDAEKYAKSLGFEIRFTPADIAQLAGIAARTMGGAR